MKNAFIFCFVAICLTLYNCRSVEKASLSIEPAQGPVPYAHLERLNDRNNFQFAIVTDRTGGHRPGVFEDGIRKLNLLQPEFVMSVGDFIEGYTEDKAELDRQWKEFSGFIDSLDAPFFYVPGNHDITNQVMEEEWKARFGKTFYHFIYKDVLFLCLNSEDNYRGAGRGTIDDEQYEWIRKTLDDNREVKWTLLFMHQPLWEQQAETLRWNDVEQLLADRKHTVYVGHRHNYTKYTRNNGKYFVLATTGGSSPLRGPQVGEFDHVVWITMTEEGPVMANLTLDGIWSEDVVTEEMKDFFSPLLGAQPVKVMPVRINGDDFDEGYAEVKVTNDSDVPMTAVLKVRDNETLWTNFRETTLTVAPNSVDMTKIPLQKGKQPSPHLIPVELEANIVYQPDNLPAVKLKYSSRIKPEKKILLRRNVHPVKVDGNLDEWNSLPFAGTIAQGNPHAHKGDSSDASFNFDVAFDESFLYIGVRVRDEEIITNERGRPTSQDGIHIYLDGRPEVISSVSNRTAEALYVALTPTSEEGKARPLYLQDRLPASTTAVTVATEGGYQAEVAIPLSYFETQQGADWSTMRLNVFMTDYDREGRHASSLWWKPNWGGDGNYAGSGTFYREQ